MPNAIPTLIKDTLHITDCVGVSFLESDNDDQFFRHIRQPCCG